MTDENANAKARETVDAIYRAELRRVFATLIRLLGDFDLAEEALHDAFASTVEQWPRDGVPGNADGEDILLLPLRRPLDDHRAGMTWPRKS